MWLRRKVEHSLYVKDSKSLIPTSQEGNTYQRITDEETEARKGEVTCGFKVSALFHEGHVTIFCTSMLDE